MTSNKKDPVLVVLQMTGAYDALNTFVPYSDPHYVDYRANLQIGPDQVLAVDDKVGFHPGMDQIKNMYDQGNGGGGNSGGGNSGGGNSGSGNSGGGNSGGGGGGGNSGGGGGGNPNK